MKNNNILSIYITFPNMREAKKICYELVKLKLIACANIFDNISSIYHWDGEIQDDKEVVIIAKTHKSLFNRLVKTIKEMHSYDVPCILASEITYANQDYIDWILNELEITQ